MILNSTEVLHGYIDMVRKMGSSVDPIKSDLYFAKPVTGLA
ncbi:hypothetical protein [Pseudoalteromonas luteoviolacea]|nr:hypothetical protein [Pseudoalteromonas luteoviolacea]